MINNAIKFTRQGIIDFSVKVIELQTHQVKLQFSVTDSGIGMTEEQVGKIFQSFSQGDNSTTRKYGGTGLGLSICKQLTEMNQMVVKELIKMVQCEVIIARNGTVGGAHLIRLVSCTICFTKKELNFPVSSLCGYSMIFNR